MTTPTHDTSSPLKIIFAGTPGFAAHHLQALMESQHQLVAVYTQPDRPSGRGKKLTPTPVKTLALTHGLPIEQPTSLKDETAQQALSVYNADVMVVVAYGLLLPQAVLDMPRYGCLNVHGSILPRWRGAAPIQRAIEAGDNKTGVTIMQMDKGLDTGDILAEAHCLIEATDTSASLHDKLMHLGAPTLLEVLAQLPENTLHPQKQDHQTACYAEKITRQEADIDWTEPATTIVRKIRAFNPAPVAYTALQGERIKIYSATVVSNTTTEPPGTITHFDQAGLRVCCHNSALLIQTLQIPGKKIMSATDILNGYKGRFVPGQQFAPV